MTGAQALAPEGFLTLADALDRAQRVWRLTDVVDAPMQAVGTDVIMGGVNLFAGGISWVDLEYDERGRSSAREETWNRLRRFLAGGNVPSSILRSSGKLEDVPPNVWRRSENADAHLTGKISYTAGKEAISGDALVKSADLESLLSGEAPEAFAPFEPAAPVPAAPVPYISLAAAQKCLPDFLKEQSERAQESGERFNQVIAQSKAEDHFKRRIRREHFRKIYGAEGLKRLGGKPRKIPPAETPQTPPTQTPPKS